MDPISSCSTRSRRERGQEEAYVLSKHLQLLELRVDVSRDRLLDLGVFDFVSSQQRPAGHDLEDLSRYEKAGRMVSVNPEADAGRKGRRRTSLTIGLSSGNSFNTLFIRLNPCIRMIRFWTSTSSVIWCGQIRKISMRSVQGKGRDTLGREGQEDRRTLTRLSSLVIMFRLAVA
jgi:hypothetical protein